MLSDRYPDCISVCNVGVLWPNSWMDKVKLGTEVGLGPGHIVLDGDAAPPSKRDIALQFSAMSVVAKRLDGSRCQLVWW